MNTVATSVTYPYMYEHYLASEAVLTPKLSES